MLPRNDGIIVKTVTTFLICLLFILSGLAQAESITSQKLYVGERLVYSVRWLGLEVGKGEVEVKEIATVRGRKAYHIVVQVRSAPILDWIYKVRDIHHSFVDVEKLHSLRYEKILKEGHYRADEEMNYDQENHMAYYHSRKNGSHKQMMVPPNVQDQLSCGFWFRLQEMRPETEVFIPVNTDEKNWDLRVKILTKTKVKIRNEEKEAAEVEPEIQFQGIFVKRGKIHGWVGLDENHIPLKMQVKIPVLGSISAQLTEYTHGK